MKECQKGYGCRGRISVFGWVGTCGTSKEDPAGGCVNGPSDRTTDHSGQPDERHAYNVVSEYSDVV